MHVTELVPGKDDAVAACLLGMENAPEGDPLVVATWRVPDSDPPTRVQGGNRPPAAREPRAEGAQ
jgi:hypothetical protein